SRKISSLALHGSMGVPLASLHSSHEHWQVCSTSMHRIRQHVLCASAIASTFLLLHLSMYPVSCRERARSTTASSVTVPSCYMPTAKPPFPKLPLSHAKRTAELTM